MYDTILFPTDGSDLSKQGIDHAVDLAQTYDAPLHTVFVVDQTTYAGLPNDIERESIQNQLREAGSRSFEMLESAADDAGVTLSSAVLSGVPHEQIIEYAESNGVDLIVMGTHGRSGFDRVLLGSTTEKVLRLSPVPVHCVPRND
ncbi:Nucleotide-binding universal stress protein, UspA family [Natronorubrum sediminis]|uniref:Nucleotide-binding universal stress protein, UspA family n=1 Tax=Natronorubrum sediminis TaxID=640943 RepID=A0A1H6G5W3_9EURY|nr:universal stress protein [Natronorubrum sediminis]SEH17848.1 Nucleotide-binding universal stress protein, UspA family [Natronorubrum sediminis]